MTSLALPLPASMSVFDELFARQRTLALYGMCCLVLGAAAFAMPGIDDRLLASGVGIWMKPAKFFVSVAIFALTAAWFFGYVRPERRRSLPARLAIGLILVGGTFELAYICFQAAQGLESHFNFTSRFHILMYGLMGAFAVLLGASTLPLAWEIARRPAEGLPRDFVAAVVIGLVLTFVLGGGLGGYMSSQTGHAVGATGGQVPVVGWNRSGGDLRIAHFLGIHAEQAIPILAGLVGELAARPRAWLLAAGTAAYVALTLGLFAQAVAGRPFL